MITKTDIDIDFADRNKALELLPHIPASMFSQGKHVKHQSGVYFQNIPIDPIHQFAVFDYEKAEELGYFKFDFLNMTMYRSVRDEEHLNMLVQREPDWSFFEEPEIVSMLNHIRDHFGVINMIKPRSVLDLAVAIALVRPGKRHLIGKPRDEIDEKIWEIDETAYSYKKAHAVAYAVSIIVQLNLICEQTFDQIEEEKSQL